MIFPATGGKAVKKDQFLARHRITFLVGVEFPVGNVAP
jgi:hypothetical protein